jgi:hypothetical protein
MRCWLVDGLTVAQMPVLAVTFQNKLQFLDVVLKRHSTRLKAHIDAD